MNYDILFPLSHIIMYCIICVPHSGAQFDVVHTSWLSRAIETAWIVMNELDLLWLPVVKSWRLNERMCKPLCPLHTQSTNCCPY